jgi:hypothetical protein
VQLGGGGGGPGGGQATPVPEAGEVIKQAAAKPPLKGRTAAVAPRTGSQVANAAR